MRIRGSFKAKLSIVLVFVFFCLIAIMNSIFISHTSKYVKNHINGENMNLAEALRKKVLITINDAEDLMTILAKNPTITDMEVNRYMDQLLKGVVEGYPLITQIYLMNEDGMQIYKTSGTLGDRSDRDYFQKAIKGELNYSDVIVSRSQNISIVVLAVPIKDNNKVVGVLGASLNLSFLSQLVSQTTAGQGGYGYIVERNGKVIGHPDSKLVSKMADLSKLTPVKEVMAGNGGTAEYSFEGEEKLASYLPIDKTDWGVIVQLPYKEAFKELREKKLFVLVLSSIFIVLSLIFSILLANYITAPVIKSMNLAKEIAEGNLKVGEIEVKREDEFGQLLLAINTMKNKIRDIIINLVSSIEELSAYSQQLSASAQEGNASIETTSYLMQEISAAIQEISASTEEVSNFAEKSALQTREGRENIGSTTNSIKEINSAVKDTVTVIERLENKSQEINKIIELINNIANQTNMLALNASIEAARAGKYGQSFAVVAEEIRQLSEEITKSTVEIAKIVKEIQDQSKVGLEEIREVEFKATEGEHIIADTGMIFSNIDNSSKEIREQIKETAISTENLSDNSDRIINTSEEIQGMSKEISSSSQELAVMAQRLRELIAAFRV